MGTRIEMDTRTGGKAGESGAPGVAGEDPWLTVIGIGERGAESLLPEARAALEAAEVVIGGMRHPDLGPRVTAERLDWPESFDELVALLRRLRPRRPVMLVAGDPLWFSIGARLLKAIPPGEILFHPQISAFQWAASRMRWSLADVETLTAHGRAPEQIVPFFWPGARLLVLTQGPESPGQVARLLAERGYGESPMVVLANLGGPEEARIEGRAADWAARDPVDRMPPFHTLAIECAGRPEPLLPRVPGLPDAIFAGGPPVLPRAARAFALALLMPARGARLWHIGGGNGAAGVEWMRAAPEARAFCIDPDPDALAAAAENARALGAPKLTAIRGEGPEALDGLPPPDAVLISKGLAPRLVERALRALPPGGRLVASAPEDAAAEALLAELQGRRGGDLHRVGEAHGRNTASLEARPAVILWSLVA